MADRPVAWSVRRLLRLSSMQSLVLISVIIVAFLAVIQKSTSRYINNEVEASCPAVCICSEIEDEVVVDCDKLGLTSVPGLIPEKTSALYLGGCVIPRLTSNSFALPESQIGYVRTLSMKNCHISSIAEDAFRPLKSLKYLDLYGNSITNINASMLNENLSRLDVDNNLVDCQAVKKDLKKDLPRLKVICNNTRRDPYTKATETVPSDDDYDKEERFEPTSSAQSTSTTTTETLPSDDDYDKEERFEPTSSAQSTSTASEPKTSTERQTTNENFLLGMSLGVIIGAVGTVAIIIGLVVFRVVTNRNNVRSTAPMRGSSGRVSKDGGVDNLGSGDARNDDDPNTRLTNDVT